MKASLSLALIALFFIQTSKSQETNFQEITQIVIGEDYTVEDIAIIKQEILNSKKKKALLKLPKMNHYINAVVEINGREITKSCANSYKAKLENLNLVNTMQKEIKELKKKHEQTKPSSGEASALNKKIEKFNALIDQHNETVYNFKMCLMTHKEVVNDYEDLKDELSNAYHAKKNTISVAIND